MPKRRKLIFFRRSFEFSPFLAATRLAASGRLFALSRAAQQATVLLPPSVDVRKAAVRKIRNVHDEPRVL